ncbi:MAG TPA: hypothetical protein VGR65_10350 [Casimicrobiaceae bacterium]|jgi:hypothetical protein|nr:hypothetical protein [Casimicrobiaceae bacterium]
MLVPLTIAAMLGGSSLASAATKGAAKEQPKSMEQMGMHHGMMRSMMHDDTMGMSECERVMSAATTPQLPADNEQLQLQMQAEMMRKMGQIIATYADEIKEEREKTP